MTGVVQPPVAEAEPPVKVTSSDEPSTLVMSVGHVISSGANVGEAVVGAPVGEAVVGAVVAAVGGAAVGDAVPGAAVGARCDGRTPS